MMFKRILIIRLGSMGDVLLTTPMIRMMKKRFPDADVDFLVKEKYGPMLETHPLLNRVMTFSARDKSRDFRGTLDRIRANRYDLIVDLQTNVRSVLLALFSGTRCVKRYKNARYQRFLLVRLGLNTYRDVKAVPLRYLEAVTEFGVEDDGLGLELFVDETSRKSVARLTASRNWQDGVRSIAMAPGASRATKQWLPERFREAAEHWGKQGYRILLVGGPEDSALCEEIAGRLSRPVLNLAGRLSLMETAAALECAELLITNDTGLMHMAAALGKPLVAVFGPTSESLGFKPFRTRSMIIERDLDCRPCSYHGTERCPKGHFKCMQEILSSDVIAATERLLGDED